MTDREILALIIGLGFVLVALGFLSHWWRAGR